MKVIDRIKGNGIPDEYLERLQEKGKRADRRRREFGSNGYEPDRRKRPQRRPDTYVEEVPVIDGCEVDIEERLVEGPKYHQPSRIAKSRSEGGLRVKSYQDLREAIELIASGERSPSNYVVSRAIDELRLRFASSRASKGYRVDAASILHLSLEQLEGALGFGRSGFGRVLGVRRYKSDSQWSTQQVESVYTWYYRVRELKN